MEKIGACIARNGLSTNATAQRGACLQLRVMKTAKFHQRPPLRFFAKQCWPRIVLELLFLLSFLCRASCPTMLRKVTNFKVKASRTLHRRCDCSAGVQRASFKRKAPGLIPDLLLKTSGFACCSVDHIVYNVFCNVAVD